MRPELALLTVDDWLAGPDDDQRRHEELWDGGQWMPPAPGTRHQYAARELVTALQAARPADPAVEVLEGVGVRLDEHTCPVPDVVVARAEVLRAWPRVLDPAAVLAVAEVVSPGSTTMDRVTKPARYAAAGIDVYWRVELDPGPYVAVCARVADGYEEIARVLPGGTAEHPYRVRIPEGL